MFGKIAKTIIVAEIIGAVALGGLIYSEIRYHRGRIDAATEIGDKFRELLKETTEKHDSEKEET